MGPFDGIDFKGQLRYTGYPERAERADAELDRAGILRDTYVEWTFDSPFNDLFAGSLQVDRVVRDYKAFLCSYGHYRMLKIAYELGASTALMMEDDVAFADDLGLVGSAVSAMPDGFYACKLGWAPAHGPSVGDILAESRTNGFWIPGDRFDARDTHATVYSRPGMEWLISCYERSASLDPFDRTSFRAADTFFMSEFYNDGGKDKKWVYPKVWLSVPLLATQDRRYVKKMSGQYSAEWKNAFGGNFSRIASSEPILESVGKNEAIDASMSLIDGRGAVDQNEIRGRMAACLSCPMHERLWCPTCAKAAQKISAAFGGRRPMLPDEDRKSGVCRAYGAYECAVASVDFGDDPVPEKCPATCWRRSR